MNANKITWRCPSNIALVKYWGKRPIQVPANPNLSMTLSKAYTEMTMEVTPIREGRPRLDFRFEGKERPGFEEKIDKYILSLLPEFPLLKSWHYKISSHNTFPHSTGIASSASSMGALGLCLASMMRNAQPHAMPDGDFYRLASRLARLASGSACRSVYGSYTIWGEEEGFPGTSDEFAIPLPGDVHPLFRDMQDAILVVSSREKEVSSRAGHALMEDHPYAAARYDMARRNVRLLVEAMKTGDAPEFIRITELEALNLHGLMMSSGKSYLLIEPGTIGIVQEIRRYREETGIPVCFTLDAGPNVHLLYPGQYREKVGAWITGSLTPFIENGRWIDDGIGQGPERIAEEVDQ